MAVEAQVEAGFWGLWGCSAGIPRDIHGAGCSSRNGEVGKGWEWNLVDLGIRSAGLTPMTISGLVLHTQPLAPSLPKAGFGFVPALVWMLRVPSVSSAVLARAGRRKFLLELSASLQFPQRGVKCSYFQLQGTDSHCQSFPKQEIPTSPGITCLLLPFFFFSRLLV